MPRSSRSKSHKQSKHSSKDVREHSDSEEDVKMKERNCKEEASSRVSRDLESGEKRKVKDPSGHGNGDASEEHFASKRRKEKADGGSDRWNSGGTEGVTIDKDMKVESSGIDVDRSSSKSKESKGLVDSKSKSSRRHDSGGEKKDVNVISVVEKEESKIGSGSRVDSKRKLEKDSGRRESHHQVKDVKEGKDKDRGSDREKKVQDIKRDADGELARKPGSKSVDLNEDRQHKRGRENTDWPIQDELRNPELEKELEKRIRRRGDGSVDKDKYQDDIKESDDRRLSSRGEQAKDGKYKDAKHKEGSHGDKYREEGDKDNRQREDKYRDDDERERKHRDVKYREDGEREGRHRDDRYRDDSDKDNRHRDEKHREDGIRENRRKSDKYREDVDRDNRRRDDKYREDGDNDDRYRDDKYREDNNREGRHKGEKYREDVDRDSSRHRDGKQGDDIDREKRARDAKYRDRHSSRDRASESETKRLRDEGNVADIHYKKSSIRDGSPIYDDRVSRYKDDNGRRRASDKEELNDIRSRSTKEQHSDAEKRSMSSAKVELVTDRGRSISRNADAEITLNHSHRRSSPSSSSHAARDHYRNSKQDESKYRDYSYEERTRHHITSSRDFTGTGLTEKNSSRSLEKSIQKVDNHVGEAALDRRLRSEARGSPLQLVDKSPSSTSNDRRHFNRPDARRSLDVEDSGQRSGGFKDANKDYTVKEGKGSRDMPMDTHPGDELSQADADSSYVSSPFTRTGHFSASSRSLLPPPPPFRTGSESSSVFGEDDNRGSKSNNNRHRRIGDPNMGRNQGNAWKGVPTWPSPVPNGFMPFQHGPPPVGFHPVMQQFPAPPIFGARPSMELNHTVPYHIPDNDRFSGHGRWRNPVDDSCPPPLHGWDANSVFGDESHLYGRLEWDHNNRSQMSSRGWETSGDMWKGQNSRASVDLPSVPLKDDSSARGPADEGFVGQSDQHSPNEQNQLELPDESVNISQSSEDPKTTTEVPKTAPKESHDISKVSIKDDSYFCRVYLSKLDISADLVQPELYEKCMNLMDMAEQTMSDDEDYPKILYMEEVGEAKAKVADKTSNASLFAAINDSVYQKAITLYKKQQQEIRAINREVSFLNAVNPIPVPIPEVEQAGATDGKLGEEAPICEKGEAVGAISNNSPEKTDPTTICPKLEPDDENSMEKPEEEPITTLNEVKMEVDLVGEEEAVGTIFEAKPLIEAHLPGGSEDANGSFNSGGNNDELLENNTKCGGGEVKISDVSTTEGCEAMMAESIECGSVNLSRIHHSPESTH
ncbi:hypothetical protein LguiB_034817 [Lonicera macranthoides]